MEILVLFAFLAGLVTVLSPCILPVLPALLGGGATGGRFRPWGIMVGFIGGFTFFTLALSWIIRSTGINPELRNLIAAIVIGGFGVILVVPKLKDGFMTLVTRLVAPLVSRAKPLGTLGPKPAKQGGFISGLFLGLSLGLVWSPCVGPIMAAVLTAAITAQVDAIMVVITLAFSLGTAIPMLVLILGGRKLLARFPGLTKHSESIQRVFGVFMVAAAVAMATGFDRTLQIALLDAFPGWGIGLTSIEANPLVEEALKELSGP